MEVVDSAGTFGRVFSMTNFWEHVVSVVGIKERIS
jgi:hypothetical protein